jgi:hypothetical protein
MNLRSKSQIVRLPLDAREIIHVAPTCRPPSAAYPHGRASLVPLGRKYSTPCSRDMPTSIRAEGNMSRRHAALHSAPRATCRADTPPSIRAEGNMSRRHAGLSPR